MEREQVEQNYNFGILGYGQDTILVNTEYPYLKEIGIEEINIHPVNYLLTFVGWKLCREVEEEFKEQDVKAYLIPLGGIAEPNAEFANSLNNFFGTNIHIISDPSSCSTATNIESLTKKKSKNPDGYPVIIYQGFVRERVELLSERFLKDGYKMLSYKECIDLGLLLNRFSDQELGLLDEMLDLLKRFPVDERIIKRESILTLADRYLPWLVKILAKERRRRSGIPQDSLKFE